MRDLPRLLRRLHDLVGGETVLMDVIVNGGPDAPLLLEHLIDAGADPDALNVEGHTALRCADFHGAVACARVLLAHGCKTAGGSDSVEEWAYTQVVADAIWERARWRGAKRMWITACAAAAV